MKRCLGIVIIFLLAFFMQVNASEIEIQPTTKSRSLEQDRVWTSTFQMAWYEFIDKYVHQPVRFREGTPTSVQILNKRINSINNVSGKSYYKYIGKIKNNTTLRTAKAIKRKFRETSDILVNLDTTPSPNNFMIYVMLKKDLVFSREFEKLGVSGFGKGMNAEYFGIGKNTSKDARDAVKVLYYNNPQDFAVSLLIKEQEEIYLYKNNTNKEFATLYKDLMIKANNYQGDKSFSDYDELKVPNIKLDATAQFHELEGKRVMGTNIYIDKVLETIKFNMDNKGEKLKSETDIKSQDLALSEEKQSEPRYFFLDDTFVIFLKEKSKKIPYFALRVNNITLFQ